jgi:hypothetical protein
MDQLESRDQLEYRFQPEGKEWGSRGGKGRKRVAGDEELPRGRIAGVQCLDQRGERAQLEMKY